MKKCFIYLLALVVLASCSQSENPEIPNSPESDATYSNVRSAADAIRIAEYAVSDEATQSRSARSVGSVRAIVDHASRGESDTLFYAVEYEDGQGFALISAPKHLEPLLALVDEGSYNDALNPNNESFQFAMSRIREYTQIPNTIKNPIEVIIPPKPDTTFARPKTEPVVKVNWGQSWPEGLLCPNGIAGCGPVGVAQILSSMELPSVINCNYDDNPFTMTIDWKELKKHVFSQDDYSSHEDNCGLTDYQHLVISRLLRQIGYLSNANYSSPYETRTTFEAPLNTLKRLSGKASEVEGTGSTWLFNSLVGSNKRVALVGSNEDDYPHGGHIWVADATWEIGMIVRHYHVVQEWDPNNPNTSGISYTDVGTISKYIHINWGWCGDCNGYFLYNLFNRREAYSFDYETNNRPNDKFNKDVVFAVFKIN